MRPMNVDTSLERDNDGLFRRTSGFSKGKAAGSSGTVTVYECRRDGMSVSGGGGGGGGARQGGVEITLKTSVAAGELKSVTKIDK